MNIPAGWYPPDQSQPHELQYWDGQAWTPWRTTAVTPTEHPPTTPMALAPGAWPGPAPAISQSPTASPQQAATGNSRSVWWIVGGIAAGIVLLLGILGVVGALTPKHSTNLADPTPRTTAATPFATPTVSATPTPTPTPSAKPTPKPKPKPTKAAPPKPWYPTGFTPYDRDAGLALKWVKASHLNCDSYTACWGVYVFARYGCPTSLYIELAVSRTPGGTIIATANDLVGGVPVHRTVMLKPSIFSAGGEGSLTGEVTALRCD